MPEDTHNKLHFPWKFDFGVLEPLGHGSYDLNNYN